MDAFVLDHNFVTGLVEVDQQHQSLVGLFNELADSFLHEEGAREVVMEDIFGRLVAYARYHFSDEEALMRQVGLDPRHQGMHCKLHEQFSQQVASLWSARSTMSHPSELFIGFLTSWLGLHILGIDQDMSRQILRMRQGQSAQQAFENEAAVPHDSSAQALLRMVAKLYRMLSEQNAELARVNAHLEDRVRQRTLEFEQANTALKHANQQLEVFSRTDGLLKIANRQYFDERLDEECGRAHRSGQPLGLLMVDVDFFKPFNDHYGHQEGDRCLQAIAETVGSVLQRKSDLVARYGGEELAVILPETDAAGAQATAQRVCEAVYALQIPHAFSGAAPFVTVSVGACSATPRSRDAAGSLLACADRALYRAKGDGRNRVVAALAHD